MCFVGNKSRRLSVRVDLDWTLAVPGWRLGLARFYDKSVPEQAGLALEGLAGVARMAHEGDLLGNQAGDMHDVALAVGYLASVKRMITVDVDNVGLCERFRPVGP